MRIGFLSVAMLASSVAISATPIEGWYASAFGGYTYLPGNLATTTNGIYFNNTAYDSGYNAGGRFGYKSTPMRYEGEYTYLQATPTRFSANHIKQHAIDGTSSANLLMANVYYDLPPFVGVLEPFLGVGLGYAHVDTNLHSFEPLGGAYFHDSDNIFAYQVTAGITYNFAENYALNAAYRYASTQRVNEFGEYFQAHLASAGIVYRFDKANYK